MIFLQSNVIVKAIRNKLRYVSILLAPAMLAILNSTVLDADDVRDAPKPTFSSRIYNSLFAKYNSQPPQAARYQHPSNQTGGQETKGDATDIANRLSDNRLSSTIRLYHWSVLVSENLKKALKKASQRRNQQK